MKSIQWLSVLWVGLLLVSTIDAAEIKDSEPAAPQTGIKSSKDTTVPQKPIILPERMSASDLKRLMIDLPGTFEIVDIRPPEHFKDYSLPGSRHMDIGDLLDNPGVLAGSIPLILVDRDGSLAMIVAGILSQRTQRPLKVLYGGLERYWSENPDLGVPGFPKSSIPAPAVPTPKAPPATLAPIPAAPSEPDTPPQPAKKKSAGC